MNFPDINAMDPASQRLKNKTQRKLEGKDDSCTGTLRLISHHLEPHRVGVSLEGAEAGSRTSAGLHSRWHGLDPPPPPSFVSWEKHLSGLQWPQGFWGLCFAADNL